MLDQALEALKSYNWGTDPKVLAPIEQAVVATAGKPDARERLEQQLAGLLQGGLSRDAKDYVCRKLMQIGTAASVPALAALLPDAENSHMARYALERITAPEAAAALREAASKLSGPQQLGVIGSLGARADAGAVLLLAPLVSGGNAAVAAAAAHALGAIRGAKAAQALAEAKPASPAAKAAVADASLACAEQLLAQGEKGAAQAIYKSLAAAEGPKHVKLAATRGLLLAAGKKE
jgi:hypothetical protein